MTNTNTTTTRLGVCLGCTHDFEVPPGPGRPAKFCGDDCRQWHAVELRRLKRELTAAESEVAVLRGRLRHPAVRRAARQALGHYEPKVAALAAAIEALRSGGALDSSILERPGGGGL